jgi:hypothetical protein
LLRDKVRGLMGIRRPRALPRRSRKPSIGVSIVCRDVRIIVPAGLSEELWQWLLEQGWREVTYRPERRVYRRVPVSCAVRLIDAAVDARARLLDDAMDRAEVRAYDRGDPDALPVYVQIK